MGELLRATCEESGSSAGEVPEGQQQGRGGAQGLFRQLHSIQYADPKTVKAITKYPEPTRMKELQSWSGRCNQLNHYIPGLAGEQATLSNLLKKDTTLFVNAKMSEEFEAA